MPTNPAPENGYRDHDGSSDCPAYLVAHFGITCTLNSIVNVVR